MSLLKKKRISGGNRRESKMKWMEQTMDPVYIPISITLSSLSIEVRLILCFSNSNNSYSNFQDSPLISTTMLTHNPHTKAKLVSSQCLSSIYSTVSSIKMVMVRFNNYTTSKQCKRILHITLIAITLAVNKNTKILFNNNKCNKLSLFLPFYHSFNRIKPMLRKSIFSLLNQDNLTRYLKFTSKYSNKEYNNSYLHLNSLHSS